MLLQVANLSLEEAVRQALSKVVGAYGVCLVCKVTARHRIPQMPLDDLVSIWFVVLLFRQFCRRDDCSL
jgi:hypothetical protein